MSCTLLKEGMIHFDTHEATRTKHVVHALRSVWQKHVRKIRVRSPAGCLPTPRRSRRRRDAWTTLDGHWRCASVCVCVCDATPRWRGQSGRDKISARSAADSSVEAYGDVGPDEAADGVGPYETVDDVGPVQESVRTGWVTKSGQKNRTTVLGLTGRRTTFGRTRMRME